MIKFRTAVILLSALCSVPPSGADDAARCYNIRDADRRSACLAEKRGSKSYCYSIKDPDHRNLCLAHTAGGRSRCYNIRDPDLRQSCLAGMGW